ncbi:MAG: hypothetical protein ACLFP4_05460 [Spirochaetales bacterium]
MKKLCAVCGVLVALGVALSAQQVTFEVVNQTGVTLVFLYVSPEDATSWGLDRLGDSVLAPGGSITLTLRGAAAYDLRAIDENEQEIVVWGWRPTADQRLTLRPDSAGTGAAALASVGWLDIVNDTNYEIAEIYVVPRGRSTDAAESLLEDARLRVAERYRLRVAADELSSLIVDVVLVDVDGDRYVRKGVDLETATELRFTLSDIDL